VLESVFKPNGFASAKVSAGRVIATPLAASSRWLAICIVFLCLVCSRAYGDVGVVLNESLDTSVEWVTGSGHTSVYFSRICPESPVKLRLCNPGEEGSVMSNYINLGEDRPYEWNIVPLSVYVYGVEAPQNRPIFGSQKVKAILEERYRDKMLSEYCSGKNCKTSDKAEWREMVGAGMSRSMYIFVVQTTVQQDLDLIAKFNALPNENHFNGVTHNCADFTKNVIDTYFPHSAHRDPINDFGMTSPKAVARSFTHYALSHPESQFRVLHFSQLPGTIRRSSEARSGTEQLYHSKKLLIPMVIFADYELPAVAAAYVFTGRFNPEHEFEAHPAVGVTTTGNPNQALKSGNDNGRADQLEAVETQEREDVVGTPEEWQRYRKEFDSVVKEAVREEIIPDRGHLNRFFKHLDEAGKPSVDSNGALWMEISNGSETSKVGLSVNNIFAEGSDSHLAFELLLARVDRVLKSPKHSRESMLEFKEDWALLQYARSRISLASAAPPSPIFGSTIIPTIGDDSD
jgi:hypothetical protein